MGLAVMGTAQQELLGLTRLSKYNAKGGLRSPR